MKRFFISFKSRIKSVVTVIFMFITIFVSNAQDSTIIRNAFRGTRFINSQSANLAGNGDLLLVIQHRFGDISEGFYELFGLDQATMRIGFEYGLGENVNIGIGRSAYMKTFDAFGKFRMIRQKNNFPFTAVITAGGSLPAIKDYFPASNDNFSDKFSGNIQLHLAKTIGKLGIQVSPGFLSTGYLPARNDEFSTATLVLGSSLQVSKKVSFNAEYMHKFNSELKGTNPLSADVEVKTSGHLFQLVISNSQHLFDQALYTNTTGDWSKGKLFLGFNLIREFSLKYKYY